MAWISINYWKLFHLRITVLFNKINKKTYKINISIMIKKKIKESNKI